MTPAEITALRLLIDATRLWMQKYMVGAQVEERYPGKFEFAVNAKKRWNIYTEAIEVVERMIDDNHDKRPV